jgi:ABC-type multidrug transport system ATPase subunit
LASARTILISTHLLEDVQAMACSVIVLDRGSLRFEGTTDALAELSGVPSTDPPSLDEVRIGFLAAVQGV